MVEIKGVKSTNQSGRYRTRKIAKLTSAVTVTASLLMTGNVYVSTVNDPIDNTVPKPNIIRVQGTHDFIVSNSVIKNNHTDYAFNVPKGNNNYAFSYILKGHQSDYCYTVYDKQVPANSSHIRPKYVPARVLRTGVKEF